MTDPTTLPADDGALVAEAEARSRLLRKLPASPISIAAIKPQLNTTADLLDLLASRLRAVGAEREKAEVEAKRWREVMAGAEPLRTEILDDLPVVGGRWMERTLADFVRACRICLADEQKMATPNNALIAVLCDA